MEDVGSVDHQGETGGGNGLEVVAEHATKQLPILFRGRIDYFVRAKYCAKWRFRKKEGPQVIQTKQGVAHHQGAEVAGEVFTWKNSKPNPPEAKEGSNRNHPWIFEIYYIYTLSNKIDWLIDWFLALYSFPMKNIFIFHSIIHCNTAVKPFLGQIPFKTL